MRVLPFGVAGVVVALATLGTVLVLERGSDGPARQASASPTVSVGQADTPYAVAVDAAHAHGMRVWIEADLVKRWLAGKDSFAGAVASIAKLASRPGVVGIKIADELGYRDALDTPAKVSAFLHDSAVALHAAAPGRKLLIDMIVPELGCLPDHNPPLRWATICEVQQRGNFPQLALAEVDKYLAQGDIDVLDLSTGLLPDATYAGWGVDAAEAQRVAWDEVKSRGWDKRVLIQARKALAHPGSYTGTAAEADAMMTTFVDIPYQQGAAAVDVWTWRQAYQGQLYRLMDPSLKSNALWDRLVTRKAAGVPMFTHMSPKSVEADLQTDLGVLSQAFTDLFVAAGTG